MEQSRFISTLSRLNARQKLRFLEFVQSPYFNKHLDVIRFNELIIRRSPALDPEQLYSALYPMTQFEARRIPDLMYKSLKLLEEFLAQENYEENAWNQKIHLLNAINTQGLHELQSVVEKEISVLQKQKRLNDSDYFYEEYQYQSEAYKLFLNRASIREDENLQQKVDRLDLFYLSAKLRDSCEMMNRTRILSAKYDLPLLDVLLGAIEADFGRYAPYPAVYIYYRIMRMLKNPDDHFHFSDLKKNVPQNIYLFGRDEQRSLYGYLQNFCIRQVNSGKADYYRELLDIYRYMMEAGLMEADNQNLQWDLKNMVSIALRLGEYAWTINTINALKPRLPADVVQNAYTYNLANYYYETKEYTKATRLLQSVEFKEVYYSLDAKSMLLKIYFEQEEEEAFFAHVNAFKTWLSRNRLISGDTVLIYNNMIRYARKAFVFKTQLPYLRKKNLKNIEKLKVELTGATQIANLSWLLRMTEKLVE